GAVPSRPGGRGWHRSGSGRATGEQSRRFRPSHDGDQGRPHNHGGRHRVTHPDPLELLRHRLDASTSETPECLDDATLAALAEGALDGAARTAVLPHLATCSRCRGAVASVARSLGDPAVAREVAAVEGRGRRRWLRIGLSAAAAAILFVVAVPRWVNDSIGHRGPPLPGAALPPPLPPP